MTESYDAESAVIGGLILYPAECCKAFQSLVPGDFENQCAAEAFRAMLEMVNDGSQPDAVLLCSGSAVSEETKQYTLQSAQTFLTTSNYDAYISVVKANSGHRRVTARLQEIAFGQLDYTDMLTRISKLLDNERSNERHEDGAFIVDYIKSFEKPEDPAGRVQTGFQRIDRALGGLRRGSLCYIGAYPSTGKTSFAVNIALRNLHCKKRVLFFSLEMSREQIQDRLFSAMLQIDYKHLDERTISEDDQLRIVEAAGKLLKEGTLSIYDNVYSIEVMAGKIAEFKPDLVIVDFLQNIRTAERFSIRKNQVDYISAELKRMARVNDCAVITLSQLARSNDYPTMSSLKESGNLEADGDYIMLLYRPYVTDKSGKFPPEQTELLLDKNKFGICGRISMLFHGEYQKFEEPETKYEER